MPDEGLSLQNTRALNVISNYQGLEYSGEAVPSAHGVKEPPFPGPNQPLRDPYNSMTDYDNGESNGSYNVFDTSHNTLPIESLQQTSNRSKSMHVTPSPHDTEPLSSLNAGRSRSDNIRYQNEGLLQQQLATELNSQDELSAPVEAEIPVVPPQKQAQKNPIQVEDDEDDELAGPKEDISARKSNGNTRSEKENASHLHSTIRPTKSRKEMESYRESDLNSDNHTEDKIQVIGANVLEDSDKKQEQEQPHTTEHEPPKPKPSKAKDKQPKKKKVKRGKTTSVTVKKTHEPDVEDDVIWVDQRERPSKSNPGLQEYSVHEHSIPTPDSISIAADEQTEHPTTGAMAEIPSVTFKIQDQGQETQEPEQKPAPPQPNKRGRKRKKTSEQVPPQQEPEPQPQPKAHPEPEEPQHENQNMAPDTTPAPEQDKEEPTIKPPETPTKHQNQSQHPGSEADISNKNKGPTKHSPIPGTSNAPYRVGLSRRARIAPLLKIIRR